MIFRQIITVILIFSLVPLQGTLVQFPSHSCFQESVTFKCTHASQLEPNYFVNIINTVLHRPSIDPSRLVSSLTTTEAVTGYMSQNLTLTDLNPSEATAIILCISVLWSDLSNATTSIQVQSDSVISLATVPPTISKAVIRVLTGSSVTLAVQHSDVLYRQDVLEYNITMRPFGSAGVSKTVSYDDLSVEVFSVSDIFDTCYTVFVSSRNCMGKGGNLSTNFIIPRLTNGSLTRQSRSEFCWSPPDLTSTCPGPYQVDILRDNVFTFSIKENNMILLNLTATTSQNQYCFSIPEEFLQTDNLFVSLNINGMTVSEDISVPLDAEFPTVSLTVRIITIVVPSVAGVVIVTVFVTLSIILIYYLIRKKTRGGY